MSYPVDGMKTQAEQWAHYVSENLYGVFLTRVICSNFTCQMLLGM